MNTASATFSRMPNGSLVIHTAYSGPRGLVDFSDLSGQWQAAFNAREDMEKAVTSALDTGSLYPVTISQTMLNAMGWHEGLKGLLTINQRMIKLTLNHDSYQLLPELVPVSQKGGEIGWLDKVAPIHRTLDQIKKRRSSEWPEKSLAIVYQEQGDGLFRNLATEIRRELSGGTLIIDMYSGAEFGPNPSNRFLNEVIRKYRAILFVGHLHLPTKEEDGGWQLTEETSLPMRMLNNLLGSKSLHEQSGRVPEVVFANCCCGAWEDPEGPDRTGLFYPRVFLDAGVNFFIGTWMDVIINRDNRDGSFSIVRNMACEFFARWSENPQGAIEHLWRAKAANQFHLLTGLYQIYSIADDEPFSAVVSSITEGDRLGDYLLASDLWKDQYARTFWAQSAPDGEGCLIQVLVDEWQDNPELAIELRSAVTRLNEAGLSQGHLIPKRHKFVMWSHAGQEQRRLHILVYERPPGERAADWSVLDLKDFNLNAPDHFDYVLMIGAQASGFLAELHLKGILHGNFGLGSMVFLDRAGVKQLIIKDTWIHQARRGQYAAARYTAPDDVDQEESADRFKYDCWGLGVFLFEITTLQQPFDQSNPPSHGLRYSPSDVMGALRNHIPGVLDRVIRECLMPVAKLRPDADLVSKRLGFALSAGGTYVGDMERQLDACIRAGQRLFYVLADDLREFEQALETLAAHKHEGRSYRLYVASEHMGLIDRRYGHTLIPWISAKEVYAAFAEANRRDYLPPPLSPPTADEVASVNAERIFNWVLKIPSRQNGQQPLLFIRGAGWWNAGSIQLELAIARVMKLCQSEHHPDRPSPVIIIGDDFIRLAPDLARLFMEMPFPSLSPGEIFERILDFPKTELSGLPPVPAETAIELAHQLYPCSSFMLANAMRLCALTYGAIDHRAIGIQDEEIEHRFREFNTVTFSPVARLPVPEFVGLPAALREQVNVWAETIRQIYDPVGTISAPRRILISGPEGCGKTTLALSLGRRTRRPVVRIDATRCLRGALGESEQTLRETLNETLSLRAAIVLLDDIDRFFETQIGSERSESFAATMIRMSGILLNWLDMLPKTFVAVMTSKRPQVLPDQWSRRIQLPINMQKPTSEASAYGDPMQYRSAVFAALFRKVGLRDLASDRSLTQALAERTDPHMGTPLLRSPIARIATSAELRDHRMMLETGAEIECWINDTILLHDRDYSAKKREFWLNALG
jgi:ATPase family associated with various cellular activities (AAA)